MRLTVLGRGSGTPAGDECGSSYLVSTPSTKILLGRGTGGATTPSAAGHATMPDAIIVRHLHPDAVLASHLHLDPDAVFISHLHLYHCYDLLPMGRNLLMGRASHRSRFSARPDDEHPVADSPVPLYVPAGSAAWVDEPAGLFASPTLPILGQTYPGGFEVREYEPGDVFSVGDCTLRTHELRHAFPTCGIRVENDGASLAYTGDTGMTDGLVSLARGVDLLLCEATLERPDSGNRGYLYAREAAELARNAGVGALVLTHVTTDNESWLDARRREAARIFDGPVHIARPGRHFDIPAR
jgi:ribonuclease BN (tRNA processing enzyme)